MNSHRAHRLEANRRALISFAFTAEVANRSHVSCKEITNTLHVQRPFLILRHVARLRECEPFDLRRYLLEKRFYNAILRFIIAAVQEERGDLDLVQVRDDRPCLERTGDVEFGGAIPEIVMRSIQCF